ncbi:hypothetical protein PKCBPO_03286 [Methylorubrum thiocyanatum]|jgi:hypothetical protein
MHIGHKLQNRHPNNLDHWLNLKFQSYKMIRRAKH